MDVEQANGSRNGAQPPPQSSAAAPQDFWRHTKILLRKNLMLKRQQYLLPTKLGPVPVPLAVLIEFVLPLAIIVLLIYVKTLTDTVVRPRGWGGDLVQGHRDIQESCVAGIPYHWERATAPDEDRITSCKTYIDSMRKPKSFSQILMELHSLRHVKLALAAEHPEHVAGLQHFRSWVTEHWYPRMEMADVPCFQGELVAGDLGWDEESMREGVVSTGRDEYVCSETCGQS